MKIYINHFNLDNLSTIMSLLSEQFVNSETYIQIYSVDGIYKITADNLKIQKLNCVDNDIEIIKNYYENFTFIIDTSYYTEEFIHQIGFEHLSRKMKKCVFKMNAKSKIDLVIEGDVIDNINNLSHNSNTEYGITPNDIYFELPNNIDINDALVKKEIIGFFSLLN